MTDFNRTLKQLTLTIDNHRGMAIIDDNTRNFLNGMILARHIVEDNHGSVPYIDPPGKGNQSLGAKISRIMR